MQDYVYAYVHVRAHGHAHTRVHTHALGRAHNGSVASSLIGRWTAFCCPAPAPAAPATFTLIMLKDRATVMGTIDASIAEVDESVSSKKGVTAGVPLDPGVGEHRIFLRVFC